MTNLPKRTCPYDGRPFTPKRANQKYCRPGHRLVVRRPARSWRSISDKLAATLRDAVATGQLPAALEARASRVLREALPYRTF